MRPAVPAAALLLLATTALAAPSSDERALAAAGRGLRGDVERLASERMGGRDNGTPESDRAQHWLLRRLRRLGPGVMPGAGLEAYRQHFVLSGQQGTNLVAVIRGRELPDEYVVVGAHYDHLDTRSGPDGNCSTRLPPGGAVCNGATDNATGTAAVLAIGRALRKLPQAPRRSVILALWDAEEDGLLGSNWFVNHPPVPLASMKAYVNFDIQGADLLPSVARETFAVSSETGGSVLADLVDAAAAPETGIAVHRLSFVFGQLRSDYANFVAKNVPTVFYSDATNGCYHTVYDDVGVVNWTKLAAQSRSAFRLVRALADTATPPTFSPPPAGLAVYADAVELAGVFNGFDAEAPIISPTNRARIKAVRDDLNAIVAGGPGAFDATDVNVLLNAAIQGLDVVADIGCILQP